MECLVVEHSPEIRDRLCLLLLEFGLLGLPAAGAEEARSVLAEHAGLRLALVDLDNREARGDELAKELAEKGVSVIAHSASPVLPSPLAGRVLGPLPKPFDDLRTAETLRSILRGRVFGEGEKRQHIRVVPDPSELLRASFRLSDSDRLYSGRVRNLSVGGAAIEVYKGPPDRAIPVGYRIPRIEFSLGHPPLAPAGVTVLYQRRLLAVRFEGLTRAERELVARYVYRKLTRA